MQQIGEGTRLSARYELTSRIAAGGMGEVWRAHDDVLDRPVAVKVIREGLAEDSDFSERFRHEARIAAQLNHPAIASVHDFGADAGTAYLVMELIQGRSLGSLLRERGALPPAVVVDYIRQAAEGVAAAHEAGVIHRDIKPENILITHKGRVKLTDFGIARALGEAKMTRTGQVLGTAQYLAPEAALGQRTGPPSDVYSLAVVAYEALAGRRPFHADSDVSLALQHVSAVPPPLPQAVPAPMRGAVMHGLAKDPGSRPRGAVEFASELAAALNNRPVGMMPPGRGQQQWQGAPGRGPSPAPRPAPTGRQPTQPSPWAASPAAAQFYASRTKQRHVSTWHTTKMARVIGWWWVGLAALTLLTVFLPWATHGSEQWLAFELSDAAQHTTSTDDGAGMAVTAALFALVFGALGVPQALGSGRIVATVFALIAGVLSGVMWTTCYIFIDGTIDAPSDLSMGAGATLFPLLGTAAFVFAGVSFVAQSRKR